MNPFDCERATDVAAVARTLADDATAHILAGGTNLVDLMKAGVERPRRLVDISRLPGLGGVDDLPNGGLRIGALVPNSDLAANARVRERYPPMDELAVALRMDPVELRIRNEPEKDPESGKPFSSRSLGGACDRARRASAGASAPPRRARCATGARASATAWRA